MGEIERMDRTPRMSGIVKMNGLIWLSGQTANDRTGDIAAQTADVLQKIEEKLNRAGSDKEHILSATIWLSDIGLFDAMNGVWDAWVSKANPPARATVEARLAHPDILVEIGITAASAGGS